MRKEDEWTCGCGHDLLNLTACSSPVEIAEAVALMETVKNDALREPDAIHRPTLAEEAATPVRLLRPWLRRRRVARMTMMMVPPTSSRSCSASCSVTMIARVARSIGRAVARPTPTSAR